MMIPIIWSQIPTNGINHDDPGIALQLDTPAYGPQRLKQLILALHGLSLGEMVQHRALSGVGIPNKRHNQMLFKLYRPFNLNFLVFFLFLDSGAKDFFKIFDLAAFEFELFFALSGSEGAAGSLLCGGDSDATVVFDESAFRGVVVVGLGLRKCWLLRGGWYIFRYIHR